MRIIEKELFSKFEEILGKHGNHRWAIDELRYLFFEVKHWRNIDNAEMQHTEHFFERLEKSFKK